jgi:hypothetical protein
MFFFFRFSTTTLFFFVATQKQNGNGARKQLKILIDKSFLVVAEYPNEIVFYIFLQLNSSSKFPIFNFFIFVFNF